MQVDLSKTWGIDPWQMPYNEGWEDIDPKQVMEEEEEVDDLIGVW